MNDLLTNIERLMECVNIKVVYFLSDAVDIPNLLDPVKEDFPTPPNSARSEYTTVTLMYEPVGRKLYGHISFWYADYSDEPPPRIEFTLEVKEKYRRIFKALHDDYLKRAMTKATAELLKDQAESLLRTKYRIAI